ncbi:hypothetical protein ACIBJF_52225 [Streptomyces sp. NPDC050743]|uniref:hypothetical protein n=1 Tax=Streptomyces sp. NPDC050743 TaxID=3365634 RepID=UPI0037A43FAC
MALGSILLVGTHIDGHLRRLAAASTVLFAVAALALAVLSGVPALVYVAAAAWGLAFGSSATLFITAAIHATADASDVAQSLTITIFNCSIGLGGLLGGILVAQAGGASLSWAALVLLAAAATAVVTGHRHAFPRNV